MKTSILAPVKTVYLLERWWHSSWRGSATLTPTTYTIFFLPTIFLIAHYFAYIQLGYQVHVKACQTRYSGLAWRLCLIQQNITDLCWNEWFWQRGAQAANQGTVLSLLWLRDCSSRSGHCLVLFQVQGTSLERGSTDDFIRLSWCPSL